MEFRLKISHRKNEDYEEYLKHLNSVGRRPNKILELGCGDGIVEYKEPYYISKGSTIIAAQYSNYVLAVDNDPSMVSSLKERISRPEYNYSNIEVLCRDFRYNIKEINIKDYDIVNLDPYALTDICIGYSISPYVKYIVKESRTLFFTFPLPYRGKHSRPYFKKVLGIQVTEQTSTRRILRKINRIFDCNLEERFRVRKYLRLFKSR